MGRRFVFFQMKSLRESLMEVLILPQSVQPRLTQLSIMKEHPELKRQIDEFRQENYVLQRTAESDELFDKLDEFSQRYDSFRRNPLVDPFLNAEAEFCRMIQEINQEIVEAVNFG